MATSFERKAERIKRFIDTQKKKLIPLEKQPVFKAKKKPKAGVKMAKRGKVGAQGA